MNIAEIKVTEISWYDNENGKAIDASVTFFGPDEFTLIARVPVKLPYQLNLTLEQVEEMAIAAAKRTLIEVVHAF